MECLSLSFRVKQNTVMKIPVAESLALTVRFLTKRFIGEYDHQTENRYKNEIMVDNDPVIFEIVDTCPRNFTDFPREELLHWADGFLLVYSIIDKDSFTYIQEVRRLIQNYRPSSPGSSHPPCPIVVVANKADLIHLRKVTFEQGEKLAKEVEASFSEIAASEHVHQVADAFSELFREVNVFRRRSKQSLLDRIKHGGKNSNKSDRK
ncbi:ras-related and estrogen-regulated growth inhibitor isoform X2 [Parasteatoda tepidariorum]|uniref:ras-related and estrogen-regulated growth inhibitor isoform X2 n=1 Tax=Parasteatoda tepidariorum TaxID=114398 RepID=UPI00077FAA0F|nr:ras-related and estrogen-regulated growth inhibitor isoform X2 [Parasteatoda tepidariorum]